MAALLRSVRLLKFSPSGLLQITGTKRNGPPLGRLYSGALGGSRTGIYFRQISPAAENTSSLYSRVWPYAVGCVHNYTVATIHKDEDGVAVRSKQAQDFDWALNKLDTSVRRTGRITKTLLLRIFHDICRAGYPSGNHALLLLRSCGSLLPELPLEERTALAHRVWQELQELGAQYDVSHYNALLKVYLQNEFKFSPTDFMAKMEAANVSPNRVTYQRLIAAYCNSGDVEGASTILGFMKTKDLPITEAVFNSLVTGHARAGDIDSAKNILTVMNGAGIEPGLDTYLALLNAHAERGDLDSLKEVLEAAESADCSLMDRDLIQVIATLAKAGHQQHIPELVERLRQDMGFVPVAMNLTLSLITQGLEDAAFLILKTFPVPQSNNFNSDVPELGNFFLRHCVHVNMSLEKISRYCEELRELKLHSAPLVFTLSCALQTKKSAMAFELMKMMKEQGLPVRPHYFQPLLVQLAKDNNVAGVVELLKSMQEIGVSPNTEMLSVYIFPLFSSMEETQKAFKDAGVPMESEAFLAARVRKVGLNSLAELYTMLSDPSFPQFDISNNLSSLIKAFKKSNDVESMVKITDLLHKDDRFYQGKPKLGEVVPFFLYHLIENMTENEVHAHELKLQKYFKQLKSQNITISVNIYRGMRNLLEAYHAPELIKDVIALVDPADRDYTSRVAGPRVSKESSAEELEKTIAALKEKNKPFNNLLKQAFQTLSAEENLQRALELKQQYEKFMTAGCYSTLISLCCQHDNVEEALNLKRELGRMDSSAVLTCKKYIELVKILCEKDRVEEAVDTLKEMKEKEVVIDEANVTTLFHLINGMAYKGDTHTIKRLQETLFTLGLCKPTANLCSPLITAYLESKDLSGALEALMECFNRYGSMPQAHGIFVALVEKGDTDLLQKAMDFMSEKRGEMNMLYSLFFAFLQTRRYREARKIIETPGLRARAGRLQWFAEKCIDNNKMEPLEQMVDMTAKLFECDRDEMYSYILRLCKETNDWQKAESVWMKMQEENVIPRERTLRMLADILKSNGQQVPFELSEMWYEQPVPEQTVVSEMDNKTETESPGAHLRARLTSLCKKGKAKEAYEILKVANEKGTVFAPFSYDQLIRALLAQGFFEEAMAVKEIAVSHVPDFELSEIASNLLIISHSKTDKIQDGLERLSLMLSSEKVPSLLALTRLIQAMARQGDLEGIKDVESLLKKHGIAPKISSMAFLNNTALAHIKNGDVDSAVEMMETFFTNSENMNYSMAFVFRRVLEDNNDKALDKLSIMAERLANHFACYRPATDLFLQLLDIGKFEDAKFMLARCNAVAEQKETLMSYMRVKAKSPGQVDKLKNLMTLIPDFAEKDKQYNLLMKCHYVDKDLPAAKALYAQMQQEECVIEELSLKRLAVLYKNAGEIAPFPEPPNTFKFYSEKLKAEKDAVTAEE